jgi:hypothetical protein
MRLIECLTLLFPPIFSALTNEAIYIYKVNQIRYLPKTDLLRYFLSYGLLDLPKGLPDSKTERASVEAMLLLDANAFETS